MTQGARGGASKALDHDLLGPVDTPRDMDAEALWNLLLAERARHAAELEERDRLDASRAVAPLRPAPDAHTIDSSGLTVAEVVERIVALMEAGAAT